MADASLLKERKNGLLTLYSTPLRSSKKLRLYRPKKIVIRRLLSFKNVLVEVREQLMHLRRKKG